VVDRDWDRDLAAIVSGEEPSTAAETVDLRDTVVSSPAAPSSDELAVWVERLGASLLRLVDRRLVDLGEEVSAQLSSIDARVDVLIDVVEALASEVAAISRSLHR
jgi:hypothetical protein